MSIQSEALILHAIPGKFEAGSIRVLPPGPDEAIVEICATGICQTDLSCAKGVLPAATPAVLGHEGAGIVRDIGQNVTHVKPGDSVLLSFYHCQLCRHCLEGHPAYCEHFGQNFSGRRLDGSCGFLLHDGTPLHSSYFQQSSFSHLTLVHMRSIIKVDANVDDLALYAPLGCGFQTGAGAVLNTLDATSDSAVAIFGAGSVGMAAIMAASLRGCKPIIAIDVQSSRLDLARGVGATHTIKGSDENLAEKIGNICQLTSGVQFAADSTGLAQVIETMMATLARRGKAVLVGAPSPHAAVSVEILSHALLGKQLLGCCEGDSVPSKMIPYLMRMHKEGRFPLEDVVTIYNFQNYESAIGDVVSGKTVKAVLKW